MKLFSRGRWVLGTAILLCSAPSHAGFWEISANGSYFKFNNGVQDNVKSTTITTRFGGGLAYRFMENTAIEFSYLQSRIRDSFGQNITALADRYLITKKTQMENYSLNLVLYLTDRKSTFRPYIRGGGGYMIRKTSLSGRAIDKVTGSNRELSFTNPPTEESASADGGLGFSLYVLDQVAIELSGTVYATDLDKEEIFLHYAFSGGLRFVF